MCYLCATPVLMLNNVPFIKQDKFCLTYSEDLPSSYTDWTDQWHQQGTVPKHRCTGLLTRANLMHDCSWALLEVVLLSWAVKSFRLLQISQNTISKYLPWIIFQRPLKKLRISIGWASLPATKGWTLFKENISDKHKSFITAITIQSVILMFLDLQSKIQNNSKKS